MVDRRTEGGQKKKHFEQIKWKLYLKQKEEIPLIIQDKIGLQKNSEMWQKLQVSQETPD